MSLLSSIVLAVLPWLRNINTEQTLIWLVAPHMLRFNGLSFVVFGVVSGLLLKAWPMPAAYGDFIAGALAIIAAAALARTANWAISMVWAFMQCSHFIRAHASIWSLGRRWVLHRDSSRTGPIGVTCSHIRAAGEVAPCW